MSREKAVQALGVLVAVGTVLVAVFGLAHLIGA